MKHIKPLLTPSIIKKHEGKCIGVLNGKVLFSDSDSNKVLEKINKDKNSNKIVFACIPKNSAILVK